MPNSMLIKARLKELGKSQDDLARQLNLATPSMCLKINGKRPFTLDEARQVADFLQIRECDFSAYFLLDNLRSANIEKGGSSNE